ncbi:MAG: DNA repair protein RecO [Candidatus Cellulosilyticum pullistercoris]|uniref:DNA repair protein RecO n=1 Tax=Candidatus Cellulosilyticum pullistercoris TaxID=2838521 RepID=A0A9E2NK91_9FIRM|nr:DNA repair protein RecO [Candidatus Cellulosilyticum pullistercoris]
MLIRTKALVVKEYIVGESDKYITLFTKEYGKIQVLAPKAKKVDRGFASATQLFVYGEFILTSFKDTYRLVNVDIIEMFHNIRNRLESLSYASYIMEFLQYVTEPMLAQPELLRLTLKTLKALTYEEASYSLIRRIYELRALAELGFMPQLASCTECGEVLKEGETSKYYFSAEAGGLVCESCKSYYKDTVMISYSTRYTLQYILSSSINKLYHFRVTHEIQQELNQVCNYYVPFYVDKIFKTVEFIDRIEAMI